MSRPLLFHQAVVEPGPSPRQWLLVLHGIFGAGRNWAGLVKQLLQARPDFGAVLVDLRGHGRSPAPPGPHDLQAAAEDVIHLASSLALPRWAVLGHSFGGKVAMAIAGKNIAALQQVWVIDAAPGRKPPGGSAWHMLQALRAMPDRFASRQHAIDALLRANVDLPHAQWMAGNLELRDDAQLHWRFDLDTVESLLRDFFATDFWPVLQRQHPRIHVVKARHAEVVSLDDAQRIEADSAARLHWLDGGHWLHVDNPGGLLRLLRQHL